MEENKKKSVKVLGSGCAKCKKLEELCRKTIDELGVDASLTHINDFAKIAKYGVMTTPALVVDEKVVSSGKLLTVDEIKKILIA